jgi:hypothetical protein
MNYYKIHYKIRLLNLEKMISNNTVIPLIKYKFNIPYYYES